MRDERDEARTFNGSRICAEEERDVSESEMYSWGGGVGTFRGFPLKWDVGAWVWSGDTSKGGIPMDRELARLIFGIGLFATGEGVPAWRETVSSGKICQEFESSREVGLDDAVRNSNSVSFLTENVRSVAGSWLMESSRLGATVDRGEIE